MTSLVKHSFFQSPRYIESHDHTEARVKYNDEIAAEELFGVKVSRPAEDGLILDLGSFLRENTLDEHTIIAKGPFHANLAYSRVYLSGDETQEGKIKRIPYHNLIHVRSLPAEEPLPDFLDKLLTQAEYVPVTRDFNLVQAAFFKNLEIARSMRLSIDSRFPCML